jgi:hypothetical protein
MVKKIRIIEEQPQEEDLNPVDTYETKMLKYQQAIDWKMWEVLKIAQAWAEREGLNTEPPDNFDEEETVISNVKSIIVDEDDDE